VSPPILRTAATRYAAAVLATGIALLVRWLFQPLVGEQLPYLTLPAAVAFSAWFCGVGPSLVSVALAILGVRIGFVDPARPSALPDAVAWVGLAGFVLVSALLIAFGEWNRRANEKIEANRRQLEAEVQERTRELDAANVQLRELTGHVLHLQDEERRRIARELHDGVGQSMVAVSINLSRLESEVRAQLEALAKTAATARDSSALVAEMTSEIRTISYLLHPPLLDEAGLGPALRWYIQGFAERSKIEVDLDLTDDFGRLAQDHEIAVFRVVQECLTNILRHSESRVAKIRVLREADKVRIEVRDQGKGIAPEKLTELAASRTPGVGIRGMRERVRQLGGTLELDSDGVGKGTVVVALLPSGISSLAATAGMRDGATR
jgi:signal transduction histidine kinase